MNLNWLVRIVAPLAVLTTSPAWCADADLFSLHSAPTDAAVTALADQAPMRVILSLPLGDAAGANQFAAAVSDPKNPLYGHFLTAQEFGVRFGAKSADYDAVRGWALAQGLTVGPALSSRAELSVAGSAGQIAALFGTHFVRFATARGDGYTVTAAPTLPDSLRGHVEGVVGLSSSGKLGMQLRSPRVHAQVGAGINSSGLAPADLTLIYHVPAQSGARTEVVALFEQDGYRASDVTTYATAYKLTAVPNSVVSVNGSTTSVTGNGAELEADLDLDMLLASNDQIKQILVYVDSQDSFQTALLDAMNLVAQQQTATVFSISYGQDEVLQGVSALVAERKAIIQLASEGITLFVSSGDRGASADTGAGLHVLDPAAQDYVTAVGGTRVNLSRFNTYYSEWVWNDSSQDSGETGGGVSAYWTIPPYQVVSGTSVAAANGGSSKYRNVPDVAAVADDVYSPVSVYSASNGGWVGVGGTSVAAPLWAGWTTIYNAARVGAGLKRLGYLNPKLYSIAEAGAHFHDVIVGNNRSETNLPGYKAGTGFDNTTGWGSIDVGLSAPLFEK